MRKVSAAQAKARLSALVAEVAFGGQHVVIERRGKAIAAIVSMAALALLEEERERSARRQGALALVGAWRDVPDDELDELVLSIYAARERDTGRAVEVEA